MSEKRIRIPEPDHPAAYYSIRISDTNATNAARTNEQPYAAVGMSRDHPAF